MSKVLVVKYDPNWKYRFISEVEKLKKVFTDNCIAIHHIGSTAVEGLSAKPIIDIAVVVKTICRVQDIPGYKSYGELGIPFRRYFSSGNTHIHVFEENNPEIEQHLLFRDYLRANTSARQQYEKLKLELAEKYPDNRTQYSLEKNEIINQIIRNTGFKGLCLRYVFHTLEEEYYIEHIGKQGAYKFILYKGAEIVAAAAIDEQLIIEKIVGSKHLNHMQELLERWILPENNSVRTQR